jgi:hypothetical protein
MAPRLTISMGLGLMDLIIGKDMVDIANRAIINYNIHF